MVIPLLAGAAGLLTSVTSAVAGIVSVFNGNKRRDTENSRETQLKIAYAQMASQWKLEETRQDFQVKMERDRQQFQTQLVEYQCQENREIQEFVKSVDAAIAKSNQQFQTWLFYQQKNLQIELAEYNRQTQLEMATSQRETVRQTEEYRKILENWPLKLVPAQIIDSHEGEAATPLRVILAPPEIDYDSFGTATQGFPKIEKRLSQGLRNFLEKHYSTDSKQRPTELLDRAWDSNRFGGGASIKALFGMLKSEPTLILESEVDGDLINLRLAYWSGGQAIYLYKTVISDFPYREILDWSAKTRALEWETKVKNKLLALGKSEAEINQKYGGDNALNLEILKEQEILQAAGIPVEQHFYTNHQDLAKLCQFLTAYHNLLTAFFADVHYLINYNLELQLPQLLLEIIGEFSEYDVGVSMLQWAVDSLLDVFKALETDRPALIPDLSIDLAVNLAPLPDKSWAQKVLDYSVVSWLTARCLSLGTPEENLAALESVLAPEDVAYVDKLNRCLAGCENNRQFSTEKIKQKQRQEEEEKRRRQREEEERKLREEREKGKEFTFEIVTVNSSGKITNRRQGSARQKVEKLANGVTLEMVYIPGGTFTMGSPESEENRSRDEGHQHQVEISPFYLGKYPVTQAQYEAIMGNNPSNLQGKNRPVESVTWHNAVKFCQKLSQKTGKTYSLPSEAEWEYACRAGTTTPFHFGEILTPGLANYDGNYVYASGPRGVYREQTTEVGSFPPNAFGLYDMHGNVWEWCQDVWHDNYNGAPTDGSAWESGGYSSLRVQRGGSWNSSPRFSRSDYRNRTDANNFSYCVGFRVVLLPGL
jgi:formylglycine-generating enzyme required for sulfatase activity